MSLIECKCPNCGQQLDFDDSREMMFCQFCGTKMLKESVVNVTNNITVAEGYQIHDADWYYNSACELISQYRFEDASSLTERMFQDYPTDHRVEKLRSWIDVHPEMWYFPHGGYLMGVGKQLSFLPVDENGLFTGYIFDWQSYKFKEGDLGNVRNLTKERSWPLYKYKGNLSLYFERLSDIKTFYEKNKDFPETLKEKELKKVELWREKVKAFSSLVDTAFEEHKEEEKRKELEEKQKIKKEKRNEFFKGLFIAIFVIVTIFLFAVLFHYSKGFFAFFVFAVGGLLSLTVASGDSKVARTFRFVVVLLADIIIAFLDYGAFMGL